MRLNRQEVVDSFYSGRGQVAKEFMPPEVVGYADDVTEYDVRPGEVEGAAASQAGLTLPVPITFWYPTDVSRPYMPDPAAQLRGLRGQPEEGRLQGDPEVGAVAARLPRDGRRGQGAGLPARLDGRLR